MNTAKATIEARDGTGCFLCGGPQVGAWRIDPDGGNATDNLLALCTPCRAYVEEGHRHRTMRMAQHRWPEFLRRIAGHERKSNRSPFNTWTWSKQLFASARSRRIAQPDPLEI